MAVAGFSRDTVGATRLPETRYALITGATSGVGHGLAHLLARDGLHSVIVARNENRLREVNSGLENRYSIDVLVIVRDLSDPAAPSEVFEIPAQ